MQLLLLAMHPLFYIWTLIMNKYMLPIASILFCFLSFYSVAADVTINIKASVIEKSCEIVLENIAVDMGEANAKGVNVGETFAPKQFKINLQKCPASTTAAHVKLSAPSGSSQYVENSGALGAAEGFAIAIYNDQNQLLDMRDNLTDFVIDHNQDIIDLNFIAAFIKTNTNSTEGSFNAVASFEISYD